MKDSDNEPGMAEYYFGGKACQSYTPQEIIDFADRMSKQHNCRVTLKRESSGFHLYMPCPECLCSHGRTELRDPKYAINLSKYFGLGDDYRHLNIQDDSDGFNPMTRSLVESAREQKNLRSGICMRTHQSATPHRFSIDELLTMPSVTVRHPDINTRAQVNQSGDANERETYWVEDPVTGKKCPPPAGKIIPILDLPVDHPARLYLEMSRKFNLHFLTEMFRCGYCIEE